GANPPRRTQPPMKALVTRAEPPAGGGIVAAGWKEHAGGQDVVQDGVFAADAAGNAEAGNAEQGKAIFQRTCGLCHATEAGKTKIGPSLHDVVGRVAGTLPGYSYSEAMKKFHQKWTPEELDHYLTDPRKVVPGTKMIFAGLKDEK